MTTTVIAAPIVRQIKGGKKNTSQDFIVAAFALGSAMALIKVLFKVITQESLQEDLDWDGTIALCISSFLGIYLSLKEVIRLF